MFEKKLFDYRGLEVRVSDYANEGFLISLIMPYRVLKED